MLKNLRPLIAVALFVILVSVSYSQTDTTNTNKQSKKKGDRALKIKSNPQPKGGAFKCKTESGAVRFRVTFESTGKISNVEKVKESGCDSFDNEAMRLAYKIKFKPEVKEGQPITVTKTLEYTFQLYEGIRPVNR